MRRRERDPAAGAADCIEDTGGLFVTTPFDDPAFADRFAQGCAQTGVPCEEISPAQALRQEPRIHPKISRAFRVPDASIDVWKTLWAMATEPSSAAQGSFPTTR